MTTLAIGMRRIGDLSAGLDRVWIAIAAIFAALALLDAPQVAPSAEFTLRALLNVAPFLMLSIGIAAYAGATGADHLISKAFQGRMAGMIVLATVFGAVSPFCSCGVVPLIAALLAMGVPLAPVMAFWLASPVMDPSMFVLTTGTLGIEFAIGKTVAALWLGLLGGFGTWWLTRSGWLTDALREGVGNGGCGGARVRNPKPPVWAFWREAERRVKFRREGVRATLFLGKWLALAFLLESLMLAYLPAGAVAGLVGGQGIVPVGIATLVGVPAYLNGYAALPLISGLLTQGMAPGAAMAFIVAGGVSSFPAAVAVFALVKKPVFLLYMLFALGGSFVAGVAFEALL